MDFFLKMKPQPLIGILHDGTGVGILIAEHLRLIRLHVVREVVVHRNDVVSMVCVTMVIVTIVGVIVTRVSFH